MPTPFSRSLIALEADRSTKSLVVLGIGATIGALWSIWFGFAQIAVYETSATARLEVDSAAHDVAAQVGGRVMEVLVRLDDAVEASDVLLRLDSEAQVLEHAALGERHAAVQNERELLQGEIDAQTRALAERRAASSAQASELASELREAQVAAEAAEAEYARYQRLQQEGHGSDSAAARAAAEAEQKRLRTESLQHRLRRVELEWQLSVSEQEVELQTLKRELARLDGAAAELAAEIDRLAFEIEERTIRTPVAGTVGEISEVRPGSVVSDGDLIASIVPRGELQATATFSVADAAGRIAPGQKARVRLDGFSWTEYGTLTATVVRVASEPRGGTLRVELAIHDADRFPVPLTHGMSGAIEVEVDRVSPAQLTLRAAGKWLNRPTASQSSAP